MSVVLVSSRSFGKVSGLGEDALRDQGYDMIRIPPEERPITEEKMIRALSKEKPEILIVGAEPVTRLVIETCPSLKMIMKHGVGIDNIDIKAATELKIIVANAPGTNTESVADLTIALMLALLRGIVNATNSTKTGAWNRYVGHELGRMSVGVVGTGRLGYSVIQRLLGFGSTIKAFDVVFNELLIGKPKIQYYAESTRE